MLPIVAVEVINFRFVSGNQFTHPCPTGDVVAQKLSVALGKQNFSTMRVAFMVLVMPAFNVMATYKGIYVIRI
jgi:hypothetical protein